MRTPRSPAAASIRPRAGLRAFLRAYGFELTLLFGSIPLGLALRALLG